MLTKSGCYHLVCNSEDSFQERKCFGKLEIQNNYSWEVRNETIHPLFFAIHNYDYEKVISELSSLSSYDLRNLNYAGQTPLHAACLTKSFEVMKLILVKGVKAGIFNNFGETPLHIAVSESWKDGVEELLKRGANPDALMEVIANVTMDVQQTPFHIAVRNGDIPTVLLLWTNNNPNFALRDSYQNSLLHMAVMSNSAHLIKLLLEREECINMVTSVNVDGDTPLHSLLSNYKRNSSESDVLKCVKILVNKRCDVNACNNNEETCLYVACKSNLCLVVEYLLSVGANPSTLTADGKSTVQATCAVGNSVALKILLETKRVGHLILHEDSEGNSPFHKAVEAFSIDCCELLIKNGDQLSNRDSKGKTRCSLIVTHIPNASELLTRIFDSNIKVSNEQVYSPSFKVIFDFSVLLSDDPSSLQKSIVDELTSEEDFQSLLKHPLLESFLHIKWGRVQFFFYVGALSFAFFLLFHTLFIITMNEEKNYSFCTATSQQMITIAQAIYCSFYLVILVPDFIIALVNLRKYFTLWETYTKLLTLSTSAYLTFTCNKDYNVVLQRNVAAISILVGWIEMMLILAKFPRFGVYILMFTKISKSMASFLFSFAFVIIGFSCSFEILFNDIHSFKKFPLTILKTIMMMMGEIDYESIYTEGNFTRMFEAVEGTNTFHLYTNDVLKIVLLTSFTFLVPILLANLLIGLAVNDIPDLHRQGNIRRLAKQAAYIVAYERLSTVLKNIYFFPNFIRKLMNKHFSICSEVTLYPNRNAKYTKRRFRVPSGTLKEAISVGVKIKKSSQEEKKCSVTTLLKQLQTRHCKDMKKIYYRLDKLSMTRHEKNLEKSVSSAVEELKTELQDQRLVIISLQESIATLCNALSSSLLHNKKS